MLKDLFRLLEILKGSPGFKKQLATFVKGKIAPELLCMGRAQSVHEVAGLPSLLEAGFVSQGCVTA